MRTMPKGYKLQIQLKVWAYVGTGLARPLSSTSAPKYLPFGLVHIYRYIRWLSPRIRLLSLNPISTILFLNINTVTKPSPRFKISISLSLSLDAMIYCMGARENGSRGFWNRQKQLPFPPSARFLRPKGFFPLHQLMGFRCASYISSTEVLMWISPSSFLGPAQLVCCR